MAFSSENDGGIVGLSVAFVITAQSPGRLRRQSPLHKGAFNFGRVSRLMSGIPREKAIALTYGAIAFLSEWRLKRQLLVII